jgi:hypothetical protein
MSQMPPDGRQGVPTLTRVLPGQVADAPVQVSAMSQLPAASRQIKELEASELAGQVVEVPSQVSAGSQTPKEVRHTVPAFAAVWAQCPLPSH